MMGENLDKHMGSIIKENRLSAHMTQEKLARKIGISRSALANIEAGRLSISIDILYKFSKVFGEDVRYLLPTFSEMSDDQLLNLLGKEILDNELQIVKDALKNAKLISHNKKGHDSNERRGM